MPQVKQCPEPRALLRFTLGLLSEAEFEPLGEHVRTCHRCATTLNNLRAADTLIDALRGNHETLSDVAPAVDELMDRLAAAPPALDLTVAYPSAEEAVPDQIGRYRILGRLGAGGMGTVYRAQDTQLRRDVALKVPRFQGSKQTAQAAALRFLREARAAAAVRHPHVCPIYDVGEHDGRPHVVMALIEGRSLDARLKEGPFADVREAITVTVQVAAALAAVHAAGIIHRDLKPANILLDRNGQALLTDFGLAREERDHEHLTAEGALIGTPAFMAPEQVTPEHGPLGPWTDQYSLAVVLYLMLAGRLPFEGSTVSLIHQIATQPLPPPSRYRPDLDPGLERILLRALARKPRDRYPEVAGFRDALLAWHEPPVVGDAAPAAPAPATRTDTRPEPEETVAYSEPRPRRTRRWWRAAAAALVLVVVGLGAYQLRIRDQEGTGKDQRTTPAPGGKPLSPFALVGNPAKVPGVDSWTIEPVGHRGAITAVAYTADSKQIASAGVDGAIRIWDENGKLVRLIVRPERKKNEGVPAPTALAWSPDAKTIACADGSGDIALVNAATGACPFLRTGGNPVSALAWSPNGELLAYLEGDYAKAYVTNVKSGGEEVPTIGAPATGLIFSPNGEHLILGGRTELQVWSLKTGQKTQTLEEQGAGGYGPCLAWSPDRKTLLAGTRLWEYEAKASRALGEPGTVGTSAAWSPDGEKVYQALDVHVAEWEAKSGKRLGTSRMPGPAEHIKATLAPNAATCTTRYVYDAYLKCVDVATGKLRFEVTGAGTVYSGFSADRKTLATAHLDNTLRLWDVATGERRHKREDAFSLGGNYIQYPVWSPNGENLLGEGILNAADLTTPKAHPLLSLKRPYDAAIQWSPDGKKIALVRRPATLEIRDTATGKELQQFKFEVGALGGFSWSPDGARIVIGAGDDGAWMVKVDAQEKPIRMHELDPANGVGGGAFSPDGKVVAVGGKKVRLCDGTTGKLLHTFDTGAGVSSIAYSPDGKRLAGMVGDRIQLWDVESRNGIAHRQLPERGTHPTPGIVTWMSDGKTVAVAERAAGVVFYDAEALAPLQTIVGMWNGQGLAVNAEGHYRGTAKIEEAIRYVIQTEKGQETLTPAEFARRFGWTNDPDRVRLPTR